MKKNILRVFIVLCVFFLSHQVVSADSINLSASDSIMRTVTGSKTSGLCPWFNCGQQLSPPPVSVTLTKNGTSALNWKATTNQPWCNVSPSSGTSSGTITVSVPQPSGAGDYPGNIIYQSGVHDCTVTVTDLNGNYAPTSVSLPLVVPTIPSNSSVYFSSGCNQITLNWLPGANAPSTNIWRYAGGSNFIYLGNTNRDTYTDTGLANGQSYSYLIQSEGYPNTTLMITGSATASCPTPITVSLSANPPGPLTAPGATTLSWTTTGNPDSCDASNYWSGTNIRNGDPVTQRSGMAAGTYVFDITCHKAGVADATSRATVTVNPATPISVSLTATPAGPLTAPGATTLSWTTTGNPDSCDASNYWSGTNIHNGDPVTQRSGMTAGTYIFDITCHKAGVPDATSRATVTVNPTAPITVSISADPNSMNLPENSTTLSWTTTGTPTSCEASNYWSGSKSPLGGSEQRTGMFVGTYNFVITCQKSGVPDATHNVTVFVSPEGGKCHVDNDCIDSNPDTMDVCRRVSSENPNDPGYWGNCSNIIPPPPSPWPYPPSVSISATPTTGAAPLSSVITWSSGYASACYSSGGSTGWASYSRTLSGNFAANSLTSPTTYFITCSNASGYETQSVTVTPISNTFDVNVINTYGGRVSSNDGQINCGSSCSHQYQNGDQVVLQAIPDSLLWRFVGWFQGPCSGTSNCSFTVDQSYTISAIFAPRALNYREF